MKLGSTKKSFFNKFIETLKTEYSLLKVVKKFKPNLIISMGSVPATHVGFLTNIPNFMFGDTEGDKLGSILANPFASRLINPNCFMNSDCSYKRTNIMVIMN